MGEHFFGKFLRFRMGQIFAQPICIEPNFVHANQANRGEMVIEAAKVTLRVWIKASFQKIGDNGTFDFQGACSDVHHMIQTCIEICFVLCQIGDAWQVDRHNANRTGAFPAAEEATALFAQFAQIKTQTAAHAAHITWLHVTVNII